MKHQYFGDINDFRKYGLLRTLIKLSGLPLGVCWLLTESDTSADGEFRGYLEREELWRGYDPELFDALGRLSEPGYTRSVHHAETWNLLPGARFHRSVLRDTLGDREAYFSEAWEELAGSAVVFFDPDNGLEVRSKRRGGKNSAKYLYWLELEEAYRRGHSVLVYQHYPRKPRDEFTEDLVDEVRVRLNAPLVETFATAHVLFVLVAHPQHAEALSGLSDAVAHSWAPEIRPTRHFYLPFGGAPG